MPAPDSSQLDSPTAAPSALYVEGTEALRISSLGNTAGVTLTISGRMLKPDNTVERIFITHTPNSNRTVASTIVALSEGWILGLTVRATGGAPLFGSTWVNLELVTGQFGAVQVIQSLGSGFVTTNTPWSWPTGVSYLPLDGAGHVRIIQGTVPGAGVEITETVPTGARWELLSFKVTFVASATVANRITSLTVDDGANIYAISGGNATAPAGSTLVISFMAGYAPVSSQPTNAVGLSLPTPFRLSAGSRIKTQTLALQAGDQYSSIFYEVREWMTGE